MSVKRIPLSREPAVAGALKAREDEERRYAMRHERLRRLRLRQREEQRAWVWWRDGDDDDDDDIDAQRGRGRR